MKTLVIYHRADFDGIFCHEIARKFLGDNAEYLGWDYGDPVPQVPDDQELYMLDISIDSLMSHPKLTWIDHHKTAIDKFGSTGLHDWIRGYRIDGVAACRLAWFWFTALDRYSRQTTTKPPDIDWFQTNYPFASKADFVDRKLEEPFAVRLAGEYDIWDKRDPDAELFQHGLRSRDLTNDWKCLLELNRRMSVTEIESLMDVGHAKGLLRPDGTTPNPVVLGLLENGRALQYAKTNENKSIITSFGFTIGFEGFCLLACNAAQYNSHLFKAGLKDEHDGMLGFNWDGQKQEWKVSLYTDKPGVDLSKVAVKFGGGGHKGVCGFRAKTLPFLP